MNCSKSIALRTDTTRLESCTLLTRMKTRVVTKKMDRGTRVTKNMILKATAQKTTKNEINSSGRLREYENQRALGITLAQCLRRT